MSSSQLYYRCSVYMIINKRRGFQGLNSLNKNHDLFPKSLHLHSYLPYSEIFNQIIGHNSSVSTLWLLKTSPLAFAVTIAPYFFNNQTPSSFHADRSLRIRHQRHNRRGRTPRLYHVGERVATMIRRKFPLTPTSPNSWRTPYRPSARMALTAPSNGHPAVVAPPRCAKDQLWPVSILTRATSPITHRESR